MKWVEQFEAFSLQSLSLFFNTFLINLYFIDFLKQISQLTKYECVISKSTSNILHYIPYIVVRFYVDWKMDIDFWRCYLN